MKLLLLATIFIWVSSIAVGTRYCNKMSSCKCDMSDGSGVMDLTSLQGKGEEPRFKDVPGTESPPLLYSWNPCSAFDEGGYYSGCRNSAVCQIYPSTQVSVGTQRSAAFSVDRNWNLFLNYKEGDTTSTVELICNKSAVDPVFVAIGDPASTNHIRLRLTSVCNCQNKCDGSGPIPTPDSKLLFINIVLLGMVWVLLLLLIVAVGIIVRLRRRIRGARPEIASINHCNEPDIHEISGFQR